MAIEAEDLSEDHRTWPAVIVGTRRFPDLANKRVDYRWCESTERVRQEMERVGINQWVSIVHESAVVSPTAFIGKGVIVGPGATIASFARIGDFVRVGRSGSVGHHTEIGDYSRLGPGVVIPGEVVIGAKVVVGPGATFVNGLRITDHVLIGAGSVVTRHITKPLQVMGNPARPLRRPVALLKRAARKATRSVLSGTALLEAMRHWYRTGQVPRKPTHQSQSDRETLG